MNRSYSREENWRGRVITLVMVAVLGLLGAGLVGATSSVPAPESARQSGDPAGDESDSSSSGTNPSNDGASDVATSEGTEESTSQPERTAPPEDLSFLCDNFASPEDTGIPSDQREELERTTEQYVLTAYGDPGADPAAYESSVEELTVEECFPGSSAGGYVEDYESIAQQGGAQSAASGSFDSPTFVGEFVLFEPQYAQRVEDEETGASYTKVIGDAVWAAEQSDGSGAVGKQQSLTLAKQDSGEGGWQVVSGASIPPSSYIEPEYESELPPGVG